MTGWTVDLFDCHDADNAMDGWCGGWWQRPGIVAGDGSGSSGGGRVGVR